MPLTIGGAVGIGNIWRFSYVAGENGGAVFLIVYLAFVFLIGVPLMIAELTIGRHAHLALKNLAGISHLKTAPTFARQSGIAIRMADTAQTRISELRWSVTGSSRRSVGMNTKTYPGDSTSRQGKSPNWSPWLSHWIAPAER